MAGTATELVSWLLSWIPVPQVILHVTITSPLSPIRGFMGPQTLPERNVKVLVAILFNCYAFAEISIYCKFFPLALPLPLITDLDQLTRTSALSSTNSDFLWYIHENRAGLFRLK